MPPESFSAENMKGSPPGPATNLQAAKLCRHASSAMSAYFAPPALSMSTRNFASKSRHFASIRAASATASASIVSNGLPPRAHQSTSSSPKKRTLFPLSYASRKVAVSGWRSAASGPSKCTRPQFARLWSPRIENGTESARQTEMSRVPATVFVAHNIFAASSSVAHAPAMEARTDTAFAPFTRTVRYVTGRENTSRSSGRRGVVKFTSTAIPLPSAK